VAPRAVLGNRGGAGTFRRQTTRGVSDMGLFNFLRDVGAKLSGHGGAYSAPTPEALENELKRLGLPTDGLSMKMEGDTVHLSGQVSDAETREKIVLAVGNVEGVGNVDDDGLQGGVSSGSLAGALASMARLPAGAAGMEAAEGAVHAATPQPVQQGPGGSMFYTVQKGDTLSAIAKRHYGEANAYMAIFEANRPMLEHPDRIYPGQVLRIPPR
jgi:LysM repeat protein